MVSATATSWAVFLVLVGAGYLYYSNQNAARNARARGRSITRPNPKDTKWMEPEKEKAKGAAKAAKKKGPKSVKKTVQDAAQTVSEKVDSYVSGDDASSATPSKVGANLLNKLPSGKDVSDMLEAKAPSANILKIIPSSQPARPAKPAQQRSETPQETKKQRQNRKKAEEAKAQREADEKERKNLMEKQRRTAREARGEPAKNGLQPSKPASNAWESSRPASEVIAPPAPLLDTFEPEAPAAKAKTQQNGTSDFANGLSEQEQLRMAMEDSAWETVPNKGKKQRKTKAAAEDSGTEEKEPVAPLAFTPVNQTAESKVKTVAAPKVENRIPQSRYETLAASPDVSHPLDSEWGVV